MYLRMHSLIRRHHPSDSCSDTRVHDHLVLLDLRSRNRYDDRILAVEKFCQWELAFTIGKGGREGHYADFGVVLWRDDR